MALTVNERDNCRASQRFSKPNQGLSKQRALPLMLNKLSHPQPNPPPPTPPLPGPNWVVNLPLGLTNGSACCKQN